MRESCVIARGSILRGAGANQAGDELLEEEASLGLCQAAVRAAGDAVEELPTCTPPRKGGVKLGRLVGTCAACEGGAWIH